MRSFLPVARPALLRLFFLLASLLLAGPGRGWAQGPAWAQAVSLNPGRSGGTSSSNAMATDAAGNQYVTGSFRDTLVLGSTTLVTPRTLHTFVAKRSAGTGAWLWAAEVQSIVGVDGVAIAVDAAGNALVTGNYYYTARFATTPAPTTLVSVSNGSSDAFVARFEAATGACTWAVRMGGTGGTESRSIAVDAGGNPFVTGIFNSSVHFATGPVPTSLAPAGRADMFVAKFGASTGACAWATQAGGSGDDFGNGVAVDAGGNALVTGRFISTARFGNGPAATFLLAVGRNDAFVAKFGATTGACIWAVQAGSAGDTQGTAVAADTGGNALVTGSFDTTASFATTPAPTVLAAAGTDVFVAKFGATTGACAWAVGAGGSHDDSGTAVAADAAGNALVTGSFDTTASFATTPAPTVLAAAGGTDVFVAKFGVATGACAWAVGAGGSSYDAGRGIAVDAGGNALVMGRCSPVARFGSLTLTSNPNFYTFFLATLSNAGTLPTRAPAPGPAFTLFPNPARRACQVQGTAAGAEVTVYDALGRPLAHAPADAGGTAQLALPDGLAPGLYLVRSGGQVQRLAVE